MMCNPPDLCFAPENTSILVLTHRRTKHLTKVLQGLKDASGVENGKVIFSCDRPSNEVLRICENFNHPNQSIIVHEDIPQSSAQAINRSLFRGLQYAFTINKSSLVVVVEDDILLSKDFLSFTLHVFRSYASKNGFRGVNLFSRSKSNLQLGNSYVIGNYGLGWGWAINSNTFQKFQNFWQGDENNHWDFIVEPYCRTGFVINPFFSRVQNIGMDETATHAIGANAKKETSEMYASSQFLVIDNQPYKLTDEVFTWNSDYYQKRKTKLVSWNVILLVARLIFFLYGDKTGHTRLSIYLYAKLKRMLQFFGKLTGEVV